MNSVTEKVNYIKGLAKGLKIEDDGDQGQLMVQLIDALDDLSHDVEDIDGRLSYIESFLEEILGEFELLASIFAGIDLDDLDLDDLDDLDDDEDLYEVVCPNCDTVYYADFEDFDSDSVYCPNCNTKFQLTEELLEQIKED